MSKTYFQINRDYLMRYRDVCAKIDRLEDRLYLLDTRLEKLSSPRITGMPRSTSSNADIRDDLIMQKDEVTERINKQNVKSRTLRSEICDAIDNLDDTQEARVLELYFIDRMTLQEIADMLVFDIRWVKRLYSRGTSHLRPPLDHQRTTRRPPRGHL